MTRLFQFLVATLALTFGCSTNAQSTAILECAIYKKVCIKDPNDVETCEKKNERSDYIVVVKRTGDIYSLEDITGSNELNFKSCKISAGNLVCQESIKSLGPVHSSQI